MESKKKILVIEDDKPVREGLVILLEKKGFDIIAARDGEEGLSLIPEIIPDLIISDIMMPGISGFTLKKFLEENERLSSIPFIFLSAKADIKDVRKGMELGADDYIIKPFNAEQLLKAIEVRLKKGNLHRYQSSLKVNSEKLNEENTIFIDVENNPSFIKISEIIAIKASGNYTCIYLAEKKKLFVRKTLNEWENQLSEKIFKRIHRSAIININKVEKMIKWSSGTYLVKMYNIEEKFNVSQRYASKLRKSLF